jgi:hypothetical protein
MDVLPVLVAANMSVLPRTIELQEMPLAILLNCLLLLLVYAYGCNFDA